jgi:ABC-2 type transport system permease protein
MSLRSILVLLKKELVNNAKNFMVVYVIVMPIILSLLITLVFGDLFSTTPELGYVDEGDSKFVSLISDIDFVDAQQYDSADDLTIAVENGAVDIGVVIPANFDNAITEGEQTNIHLLVWGERVLKDQAVLDSTLRDLFTNMAGYESAVAVEPVMLGEASKSKTIQERLLPMMVLMAVVLGGIIVPAMSLVEEKEKKTLKALVVTPTSMEDIFVAKGLFGVIAGVLMAVIILVINQMFGTGTDIILVTLIIAAIASAAGGVMLGASFKDTTSLMAVVKATGIVLYAPGIIQIFPDIPQWIAKIFPTYYMIGPITEVTQNGGGWSDVTLDLTILIIMTIALIAAAMMFAKRVRYQPLV